MELVPINLKDNDMALKNCAYLSPQLAKDPSKQIHVKIRQKIIKTAFSNTVEKSNIGMSKILREFAAVDLVHPVRVEPYQPKADQQTGLSYLKLEITIHKKKDANKVEVDDAKILQVLRKKQTNTFFNVGQTFYVKSEEVLYVLIVQECFLIQLGIQQKKKPKSEPGRLVQDTQIELCTNQNSGIILLSGAGQAKNLFRPDFQISDMGIGGLDEQLFNIFRRSFASRRFPPSVVAKFGIKHVKGILLYGPPGTGKTLIARQLSKALNAKNLQIVNGPQIFSKFQGQSQQNIRKLFLAAREDQKKFGDSSPLHVIVFDEIDAICKQRGVYSGGSQVADQVVNQLLTNIDGVQALNNILVIGMTNRKDLLDDAILRPGRLQVHVEVKLPDYQGRQQIFKIHTKKLCQNNLLKKDFSFQQMARLTRNYTGAQIQALVKCASSFSIARTTNIMQFSKELMINEQTLGVSREDFLKALNEVKPQFGTDQEKLASLFRETSINYGGSFQAITNTIRETTVMNDSGTNQIRTVLLHGNSGTGKTMMAINYAKHCTFPYIKVISPEKYIGFSDQYKIQSISKVFQDAYKTTNACIIVDDIQRLIDFSPIGWRFNNNVLQALLVLLSKVPPRASCKLLVLATCSQLKKLQRLSLPTAFDVKIQVPSLNKEQIAEFIENKFQISSADSKSIAKVLIKSTIKDLIQIGDLVINENPKQKNNPQVWQQYKQTLIEDYQQDFDV